MRKNGFLFLLVGVLTSCVVGPDYIPPKLSIPPHWVEAKGIRSGTLPTQWWTLFRDPVLDRLISEAIASNLELKQAETRIREARAQRAEAVATGLPSIDGHSSVNRRLNNFGGGPGGGGSSSMGFPIGGGPGMENSVIHLFQAGFDAQWELDLFGSVQRAIEVAEATTQAEEENRRDILVTLLGEVARNYLEIAGNQRQITITRANLATQEDTLSLIQSREQGGLASQLEVAQQSAQVEATRSQLPTYETTVHRAVHALAVLLGKTPNTLQYLLHDTERKTTFPTIEVVIDPPVVWLRHRPDIRRAERLLAAATAQVGIATAELYPKVNLSGFLGLQNIQLSKFSPVGESWNIASSVSLPIFNWGRIRAHIDLQEARQESAFLTYQYTVLNAVREVEDALVAYLNERARGIALSESVTASRLAVHLAEERYHRGLTAFLDVLESQRALYQSESNLTANETQVAISIVALYKALGGGG